MAYVAMPEAAAEMMFQIIAGRAERAAVIVTTNLPFSEWTTMFPNVRLCKAMLDRCVFRSGLAGDVKDCIGSRWLCFNSWMAFLVGRINNLILRRFASCFT